MNYILTYLMVGISLLFLYEMATNYVKSKELHFNNRERLIVWLIWPIALLMFIWALFKVLEEK